MPNESKHSQSSQNHEHTVLETFKSLIMAFVLAMTFRGFVAEGFVIPTGSMAPTLMGQHALIHSDATGSSFPIGMDPNQQSVDLPGVADPMLGPEFRGKGMANASDRKHMGDRILVIKTLYPFFSPRRFDVVVFKNPTEPVGASANYIKRLIGLPNEKIWLVDGDIFAGPSDQPERRDDYRIQRKPEHVQRAVWQSIAHSDFLPDSTRPVDWRYNGPPWVGNRWETRGQRFYRSETDDPTTLRWRNDIRAINDWTAYNQPRHAGWRPHNVSDIRIRAGIIPDREGLKTTLQIRTRMHDYQFIIADGKATVRMARVSATPRWTEQSQSVSLPGAGKVFNIEFWHVDQSMALYIDGKRVAYLEYDWLPEERLRYATNLLEEDDMDELLDFQPDLPEITWFFEGSPVSLHRVALDRDLHYRTVRMDHSNQRNNPAEGYEELVRFGSWGFGTHPDKPAVLGPDHFLMLGDNSARSLDGRLWGSPAQIVAEQIDPMPFVVNRKLLMGKAWVVYFPSMHALSDNGRAFIPDFGRMRFIR